MQIYFDAADRARNHPDVEDVLHIGEDENGLFHEPNWTLDKLMLSVGDNMRLSMRSAFDDVKTACATGGV